MSRAKKTQNQEPQPIVKSPKSQRSPADTPVEKEEITFVREYWTGDSRDGVMVNGDGYHYYRMTKSGRILEAYEFYETDDGREYANPLPEMINVNWIKDLGFDDFDALDAIKEYDFDRVKEISDGAGA